MLFRSHSNIKINNSVDEFCKVATKIFNIFEQQDSQQKSFNEYSGPRWGNTYHKIPSFAINTLLNNEHIIIPNDLSNKVIFSEKIYGLVDIRMKKECFSPVKIGDNDITMSLKMGYPKKRFQGLFEIDGQDSALKNGGFIISFDDSKYINIGFDNSFDGTVEGFNKKLKHCFQYIINNIQYIINNYSNKV